MALDNRVDSATRVAARDQDVAPPTPGADGVSRGLSNAKLDALPTQNRRASRAPVDLRVARLAAKHHRVVTWRQLRALGLNDRAVRHRVNKGRLYRVHRGVYLLEPPEIASRITLLAAAVAACEPDDVLSHHACAELWELRPSMPGGIDVTVVGRNPGSRRAGIRVHRAHTLDPRDIRICRGLRVTAPPRVVLELSALLERDQLENLIAHARAELSVTEQQLLDVLERYPGYLGARSLRRALTRHGGPSLTRSQAERRLLDLIRQADLPAPATNFRVGRYEVDFVWPQQRLAVETDGYAFHHDRASFERDRRRDAALLAGGFRVMRFTWRQLVDEPFTVVARIAQVLAV